MTRTSLRRRGERSYFVWVKGRRIGTQQRVTADTKDEAVWRYARFLAIKTIECDAVWIRA